MLNRVSKNFVAIATKVCPNIFIQSVEYRSIILNLKFSVQTRSLETVGYKNPITEVGKKYDKLDEEKLNELLKNPDNKAKYDKCKLEIEYWKCVSEKIPKTIDNSNWLFLLQAQNKSQRRSYIEFLWKIEKKDENRKKKKELRKAHYEEKLAQGTSDDMPSGLAKNTMFFRIREKTINEFYNSRLISAILHEPKIIFDLGYEHIMAPSERNNCAKQLLLSFAANRLHDDPCDLYFCNAKEDSAILKNLHKTIPNMYNLEFPLNITSKSYLDIFDKKQLVYLTPHTDQVMKKFDPNLVYIIGAMVDKIRPLPVSFQKAKKEGIRMMRFPLAEKLEWGTGSTKTLPLNQVLSILLDLRYTNNWDTALQNVPRRKLQASRLRNLSKKLLSNQKKIFLSQNE